MPGFVPVVYSGGGPVLSSGGAQRVACEHLAEWLVVRDALEVARGRGHIRYFQTQGNAKESYRTHLDGSAQDRAHVSVASVMDSREMGMAEWPRITAYGWTGAQHDHGMIRCGHNAHNLYQWTAYLNGWNGLGLGGQGAGDPLPRPAKIRTWREGIVWAKAEIARLNGTAPATTEDDMPRLLISQDGSGWLATDRGITPVSMLEAQAIHRVLTATEYDPGSAATDRIDAAQLTRYADAVGRANGPAAPTTSVTANFDPAVLSAAVNDALTKALGSIAFTTRKA